MDALDVRIQRARAVPLETVLEGFGAQRDPKDPKRNWKVGGSRITVAGDKFFDHNLEKGGGGAIDLKLHLEGRDFARPSREDFIAAVRWLAGTERIALAAAQRAADKPVQAAAAAADAPPQEPPLPDASRLARVRWYLSEQRAIPGELVERAIDSGLIFADSKANVVFRLRDETGREVGYEKRGTYGKAFHGVYGDKGLFFLGGSRTQVAAFVESGVEALSYKALRPDALVVSTTGNAIELPERMGQLLLERGYAVIAAFNADRDGDRFAHRFAQRLGAAVQRDRPDERAGKDWNHVLRAKRETAFGNRPPQQELAR